MRTLDRYYMLIGLVIALGSCATKAELLPLSALPAAPDGGENWSYIGPTGPSAWASLRPEFAACGSGNMQSPIDLALAEPGPVTPIQFHYVPSRVVIKNDGHTVQASFAPGDNWITINGSSYQLIQFHYHHPAEHLVNGDAAPIEVHLVHQNAAGEYVVVGILFDKGNIPNGAVRQMLGVDPDRSDSEPVTHLDPSNLLPPRLDYVTYDGSLTTPPCTENVKWVVFSTPGVITPQQFDKLNDLVPYNARPIQSLGRRTALTSGKVH